MSKFAVQEGLDSVVISDLLANDLFGTTKAVGNIVKIEQKYYQVTGVYKKYPTILEGLLDDGQERIYIPFNSGLSNQWQIENLIISSECLDGKTISVLDLDRINVTVMNSFINDQSDAMLKIRTARNMPLYIVTIIIIVTLTKLGYREIKEVINQQKKIRIAGLKLLLYGVIIYLLYRIELCNIYIPPSALPNDNIFDIGFYLEYFKNQRIHYNYLLQNSISNYTRSYQYVLNTLNVFGIIQIACYGLGYKIIGVYLSNRKVFAKRGQEVSLSLYSNVEVGKEGEIYYIAQEDKMLYQYDIGSTEKKALFQTNTAGSAALYYEPEKEQFHVKEGNVINTYSKNGEQQGKSLELEPITQMGEEIGIQFYITHDGTYLFRTRTKGKPNNIVCLGKKEVEKEIEPKFVYTEEQLIVEGKVLEVDKVSKTGETLDIFHLNKDGSNTCYSANFSNATVTSKQTPKQASKTQSNPMLEGVLKDGKWQRNNETIFLRQATYSAVQKDERENRIYMCGEYGKVDIYDFDGNYKYRWLDRQIGYESDYVLPGGMLVEHNSIYLITTDSSNTYIKKFSITLNEGAEVESGAIACLSFEDNGGLESCIKKFNEKKGKNVIELKQQTIQADSEQTLQKISTEIMEGSIPTILEMKYLPYNTYIQKDILMPLNEVVREVPEYNRNIIEAYSQEGQFYVMPLNIHVPAMTVNAPLLKQFNIEFNKKKYTFDEWIRCMEQINMAKEDEDVYMLPKGTVDSFLASYMLNIHYDNYIYNKSKNNWEQSLEKLLVDLKLLKTLEHPKYDELVIREGMKGEYEKVVFMPLTIWDYTQTVGDYTYAPMPILQQESYTIYTTDLVGISKSQEENRRTAIEFIQYAVSDSVQKGMDGLPINNKSRNTKRLEAANQRTGDQARGEEIEYIISKMNTPIYRDVIIGKIKEESKKYLQDQQDIDRTISNIKQVIELNEYS